MKWACQNRKSFPPCRAVLKICLQILRWIFDWCYFVALICFVGAVVGVSSHLLYGVCFAEEPDYRYLAAFGLMNGLKYAGVWAGGAAIVLCVIRARKEFLAREAARGVESK